MIYRCGGCRNQFEFGLLTAHCGLIDLLVPMGLSIVLLLYPVRCARRAVSEARRAEEAAVAKSAEALGPVVAAAAPWWWFPLSLVAAVVVVGVAFVSLVAAYILIVTAAENFLIRRLRRCPVCAKKDWSKGYFAQGFGL